MFTSLGSFKILYSKYLLFKLIDSGFCLTEDILVDLEVFILNDTPELVDSSIYLCDELEVDFKIASSFFSFMGTFWTKLWPFWLNNLLKYAYNSRVAF